MNESSGSSACFWGGDHDGCAARRSFQVAHSADTALRGRAPARLAHALALARARPEPAPFRPSRRTEPPNSSNVRGGWVERRQAAPCRVCGRATQRLRTAGRVAIPHRFRGEHAPSRAVECAPRQY
eukprot:3822420-Pleurochrysis_carterae.AAC.1